MKRKLVLILVVVCCFNSFSQIREVTGQYTYSTHFYSEYISLLKSGQFIWYVKTEFLNLTANGNWQIRNDSLLLDSQPQKVKLLVWESYERKLSNINFFVTDKSKNFINYTLYTIGYKNDTIIYKDQFQKTKIKDKVNAFFLIDAKGFRSPTYFLKGKNINRVDVLFETTRVFENECWLISNGVITPRGADGEVQKYNLLKKQ